MYYTANKTNWGIKAKFLIFKKKFVLFIIVLFKFMVRHEILTYYSSINYNQENKLLLYHSSHFKILRVFYKWVVLNVLIYNSFNVSTFIIFFLEEISNFCFTYTIDEIGLDCSTIIKVDI